jgi:anti-sigma factor ChrR (cupin superfamily)
MPLKENTREAILKYIKRHEKHVMKDSLFSIVGSFSTEEGNWSEGDEWRD